LYLSNPHTYSYQIATIDKTLTGSQQYTQISADEDLTGERAKVTNSIDYAIIRTNSPSAPSINPDELQ
jgi:hypothetical protein